MINIFLKEEIIMCLASIFDYGFKNNYSLNNIEERLIASKFINKLENNEFDSSDNNERLIVNDVYGIQINEQISKSFESIFFAERYIELFFDLQKSFEYIFLYWPLTYFVRKYNLYHEMPYSSFKNDFLSKTKETSLLKMLSTSKHMSFILISELTSISRNTIQKYITSDESLYKASFENIYKLANVLKVKPNIFIERINVYLDESIYYFSPSYKEIKSNIGHFLLKIYDPKVREDNYKYKKDEDIFVSNTSNITLKVISLKSDELNAKNINKNSDSNTYLIIFLSGIILEDKSDYSFLQECVAHEIVILNGSEAYFVKKNKAKTILEQYKKAALINAKTNVK